MAKSQKRTTKSASGSAKAAPTSSSAGRKSSPRPKKKQSSHADLVLVLLAALRSPDVYRRLAGHLAPEMFRSDYAFLYKALSNIYEKEKERTQTVPMRTLRMCTKEFCPKNTWDERVKLLVDRWERTDPPSSRAEQEVVQQFIIQEGLATIGEELLQQHDFTPHKMDPWQTKKKLEHFTALALVPEDKRVLDYAKGDPTKLFQKGDAVGRVPVGVARVDDALDGGLGPGELGILVAPSGGGKTAVLINLGCRAVLLGKTVLHVTLEIRTIKVAERATLRISGHTKDEIREDPAHTKRALSKVQRSGGRLLIHDLSHESVSMQRLEGIIARYKPLDLVLVDYADLLGRTRVRDERRVMLGGIYKELRRLASAYDVPIWTASQTNREAMGLDDFGKEHIAEDISKIHTGDVVICLIQTPDEKAKGIMRLKVDKTREASWNPVVNVRMDYDRMTLTDVTKAVTKHKAGGKKHVTKVHQRTTRKGRKDDSRRKGKARTVRD